MRFGLDAEDLKSLKRKLKDFFCSTVGAGHTGWGMMLKKGLPHRDDRFANPLDPLDLIEWVVIPTGAGITF